MRLTGKSWAIALVTIAFWSAHVSIFTLKNVVEGNPNVLDLTLARVLLALAGALICYGLYRALRVLRARTLKVRVALLALAAPFVADGFAWVNYFTISFASALPIDRPINWADATVVVAMWTWFFFAWGSLVLAIEYSYDMKDERLRLSEYEALAHQAKLRALHYQINPHFLFNGLNSLSALILDRRIDEANIMVMRLANFFRRSLSSDPTALVTLDQEVELQLDYLDIELVRYPDLRVEVEFPYRLRNAEVPSYLLQPLVENAVKHGVARSSPPASIKLSASDTGGRLKVSVKNSGRKATQDFHISGTRTGISYVRARVENLYGAAGMVTAGPVGENSFVASIELPLSIKK